MATSEILEAVYDRRRPPRIPFVPALYDFKATLAGVPGHLFGRSADEYRVALDREVEELGVDAVTVGYDIYNVEAEALGAKVDRSDRLSMPEIAEPAIERLEDSATLRVPDGPSDRMVLLAEVCRDSVTRYDGVAVRCGMSGPFSVAASLYPRDRLLVDLLLNPVGVSSLLRIAVDTIKVFCDAVADTGADVVLFDSFVSPPLVGPAQYEAIVQPLHREIIDYAQSLGVRRVSLIAGGDTRPIVPLLEATGATSLLLDYAVPAAEVADTIAAHDVPFRVNLAPQLVAEGTEIEACVGALTAALADCPYWICGTGILSAETPVEHIRLVRALLESTAAGA